MKKGITSFQPHRLIQALSARRLSQVQLAAMVGVSPPTVSKWRSGTQSPEPDTLERLALVVNVSPEWFTRPSAPQLSKALFRSNASAHVAAREMLAARLHWVQDIALYLENSIDFPEVNLPERDFRSHEDIDYDDIESAAAECRSAWGLGSGPIPDLVLALESAGVIVIREVTGVSAIEGVSAWSAALHRPLVLLAADKGNAFRGRFDAGHELGHLVLHKHIRLPATPEVHKTLEDQAHKFAGALLMPASSFTAEVRLPVTLDNLLLLKQRWGVSVAAMIMRLHALGIITDEEKLTLFKRRSARWGAKSEPGDDKRTPEEPRLLRRSVELILEAGIMDRASLQPVFGLSSGDIESVCGLPGGFLGESGEVIELASLKSVRTPSNAARTTHIQGNNVLTFKRR